jgi:hypothetical protein
MTRAAALLCFLFVPAIAAGDAIPPGPRNCPKGHTPRSSHSGQWCQPPAPKCGKGEKAMPTRGGWYCEPAPPKGGCPPGSEWRSSSRIDTWCEGRRSWCDSEEEAKDPACVEAAYCVTEIQRRYTGRVQGTYIEERVVGPCGKDNACPGATTCVTAKRHNPTPPAPPPPPKKSALLLLPLLGLAIAVGAAFRRRRQ